MKVFLLAAFVATTLSGCDDRPPPCQWSFDNGRTDGVEIEYFTRQVISHRIIDGALATYVIMAPLDELYITFSCPNQIEPSLKAFSLRFKTDLDLIHLRVRTPTSVQDFGDGIGPIDWTTISGTLERPSNRLVFHVLYQGLHRTQGALFLDDVEFGD